MSGRFLWYDLQSTDVPAAAAFYAAVVGWKPQQVSPPPDDYTTFNVAGGGVAGIASLAVRRPTPPPWMGYVAVDDVDEYARRLKAAGGAIHQPPRDIPGTGRFAGVADPQGAIFYLLKPDGPPGSLPEGGPGEPGFIGWHELMASDGEAAFSFYAGLFGWTPAGVHDMGPMGAYRLWTDDRGRQDVGGIMTKPADMPLPHWRYYFQVDGIDAAAARVTAAGGTVANGPHEVPSGDWVLQGADPQGVAFHLVSTKK